MAGVIFVAVIVSVHEVTVALDRDRTVANGLEALQGALLDAETAERGYLLTRQESYLDPYLSARRDVPILLSSLDALLADEPLLRDRIGPLRALSAERLDAVARTVDRFKASGAGAAVDLASADSGKTAMDRLRDSIRALRSELGQRAAAVDRLRESRVVLGFIAALVAAVANTIAFFFLYRAVSRYHEDREDAEAALWESSLMLRAVSASTQDWIFAKDRAGRLVFANPPLAAAFKAPLAKLMGKTALEYMPDRQQAAAAYADDMRIMSNAKGETMEQVLTMDDVTRYYSTTKTPRFDSSGRVIGLVAIATEITKRKRAEQALQALNEDLSQRVEARTSELEALTRHLMQVAEDEKARLAAELHDEMGGVLTVLSLDAERVLAGVRKTDPALAERQQNIVQLIRELTTLQRRIVQNLRPVLLEHFGLVAALQHHMQQWSVSSAIEVSSTIDEALPRLDGEVALALFRVAQESLTNVARYAQARRVSVALRQEDDELQLLVDDDGTGIDEERPARTTSQGVLGMTQRIAAYGGKLTVRRGGTLGGTQVFARIPLAQIEAASANRGNRA